MNIEDFYFNDYWKQNLDIDSKYPSFVHTYTQNVSDNLLIEVVFISNEYKETNLIYETERPWMPNGVCREVIKVNNCLSLVDIEALIKLFSA